MKEKYLNVSVCPGEKSHWDVVRSMVMFGKGKGAVLPAWALCSARLPGWQRSNSCAQMDRILRNCDALLFTELGFGSHVF
jgi:hypothetical protein